MNKACTEAGAGDGWTPRELRTTFLPAAKTLDQAVAVMTAAATLPVMELRPA